MGVVQEHDIVANGLRHHVIVWGDAPVDVVLCHGFLDMAWSFDALARALAGAGHGVAAFDWRGHGQSQWIGDGGYYHFPDYVLDLDQLLRQIAPDPIHLVGHSMGGVVSAMFAASRGERLKTVSLVEGLGPPERWPFDPAARLRTWLDGAPKARKPRRPIEGEADALRRLRVQNPDLPDDLGRFLVSKSTRVIDGGIQWSFDPLHKTFSPRRFDVEVFEKLLAAISVPTLVVAGERGFRLEDEQTRLSKIRDRRFVEIGGVGHMIHWFEPERLCAELTAFFDERGT